LDLQGWEHKGWLQLLLPAVNWMAGIRSRANTMATQYPESRVLVIMTGGTICMKSSPEGLVPARGFLEQGMAPRPSFNDGSQPGMCDSIFVCASIPRASHLQLVFWCCWRTGWRGEMQVERGRDQIRFEGAGAFELRGSGSLPGRSTRVQGASSVARLLQEGTVAASEPLFSPEGDDRLHSISYYL
jgi:hypothetical protein